MVLRKIEASLEYAIGMVESSALPDEHFFALRIFSGG